jgi:hypothetical protein
MYVTTTQDLHLKFAFQAWINGVGNAEAQKQGFHGSATPRRINSEDERVVICNRLENGLKGRKTFGIGDLDEDLEHALKPMNLHCRTVTFRLS